MERTGNKPKSAWRRFLERLAKANQESFGSEPPSCCGGAGHKPTAAPPGGGSAPQRGS